MAEVKIFRFMDLPGEIRNKIYEEALCCFDPPTSAETTSTVPIHLDVNQATHSINTAILQTCRRVYREAFDVMVKTNQFIKVSSVDVPIFSKLLLESQLPVVTMDRAVVDRFSGCVMSVDLSVVPGEWVDEPWEGEEDDWEADFDPDIRIAPAGTGPRFKILILRRDWYLFCDTISKGDGSLRGFNKNVKVELKMNAYPEELPDYKSPIDHYFTVERQKSILGNFGSAFRGFQRVSVAGTIDEQLARSVVQIVKGLTADAKYATSKQHTVYTDIVKLMRQIHCSPDFRQLKNEGWTFLASFAEIHFNAHLSMDQALLNEMQDPNASAFIQSHGHKLATSLEDANESQQRFGSSWQPSAAWMGKYFLTLATGYRLWGQAATHDDDRYGCIMEAVNAIEQAGQANPGDVGIVAERDRIFAWETEEAQRYKKGGLGEE